MHQGLLCDRDMHRTCSAGVNRLWKTSQIHVAEVYWRRGWCVQVLVVENAS